MVDERQQFNNLLNRTYNRAIVGQTCKTAEQQIEIDKTNSVDSVDLFV